MVQHPTTLVAPTKEELASSEFWAALEADSKAMFEMCGFEQTLHGVPIEEIISADYVTDLKLIVQMVRWYMIGLVSPQELAVYHPVALMEDLRSRMKRSRLQYLPSQAMEHTTAHMIAWWEQNTITSSWRTMKAHAQIGQCPADITDALADFLWQFRDIITASVERSDS